MKKVYINEVHKHLGKEITLNGWLYNKRSSGKIHFLQLRDGTGIIQCVVEKKQVSEELFSSCKELSQETSLSITGTVKEDSRSDLGYELGVKDVTVVYESQDYPITPKEHGVGFLMDNRHLWLRSKKQMAILRIRHRLCQAIRNYFDKEGFYLVDSPILTPTSCEGTSELFEVKYFDDVAYLTQSGQLYAEASAKALGKVYCFGPTFRSEKSKTRRHLTEFWMVEPEVSFNTHEDNMDLAEDFVEYIVQDVVSNCKQELKDLERDISKLENIKKPMYRIHYREAVELIQKEKPDFPFGEDFGGEDETILASNFDKPVIITHYPADIKAFYMKRDPEEPEHALCFDMIAPEGYGQIIGASSREHDYDTL